MPLMEVHLHSIAATLCHLLCVFQSDPPQVQSWPARVPPAHGRPVRPAPSRVPAARALSAPHQSAACPAAHWSRAPPVAGWWPASKQQTMPVSFSAGPHSSCCLVACKKQVCRDCEGCLWRLPSSSCKVCFETAACRLLQERAVSWCLSGHELLHLPAAGPQPICPSPCRQLSAPPAAPSSCHRGQPSA